jgi:hypothetical protein
MIIRTFNQCIKVVHRSKILIATDDRRIQKICTLTPSTYKVKLHN